MDPKIAHGAQQGKGYPSDVWPDGHAISAEAVDAFARMARGWLTALPQDQP